MRDSPWFAGRQGVVRSGGGIKRERTVARRFASIASLSEQTSSFRTKAGSQVIHFLTPPPPSPIDVYILNRSVKGTLALGQG